MSRDLDLQETIDTIMFEIADMKKRQSNYIRPGTVVSWDAATNTAIVDVGFKTDALPVFTHAGVGRHWNPLKVGQQITMMSPDGDPNNAFVIPGGYHDGVTPPSTRGDEDVIAHDDAAIRVRSGGIVRAEVTARPNFKILIGGTAFAIKAEALEPTSSD